MMDYGKNDYFSLIIPIALNTKENYEERRYKTFVVKSQPRNSWKHL
jgi:hypothetical protein